MRAVQPGSSLLQPGSSACAASPLLGTCRKKTDQRLPTGLDLNGARYFRDRIVSARVAADESQRPYDLNRLKTVAFFPRVHGWHWRISIRQPKASLRPVESTDGAPIAEPAVLVANGNPNTDAASLLAAGGPGNPALPGFANVARSGEYGSVIYLGAGWALTANHVSLTSTINFGGTWYTVDTSSVRQLKNANNTSTDLKMFRVQGDPPLPNILNSYIASAGQRSRVHDWQRP